MALDTRPIKDTIELSAGQDFQLTVVMPGTNELPTSTTAEIEIRESSDPDSPVLDTWDGICSTTTVSWWIQADRCDSIPDRAHFQMLIHIPSGGETLDRCWFNGPVKRFD